MRHMLDDGIEPGWHCDTTLTLKWRLIIGAEVAIVTLGFLFAFALESDYVTGAWVSKAQPLAVLFSLIMGLVVLPISFDYSKNDPTKTRWHWGF